jgi:hypothetical protein
VSQVFYLTLKPGNDFEEYGAAYEVGRKLEQTSTAMAGRVKYSICWLNQLRFRLARLATSQISQHLRSIAQAQLERSKQYIWIKK